jgi:hypothetical protein
MIDFQSAANLSMTSAFLPVLIKSANCASSSMASSAIGAGLRGVADLFWFRCRVSSASLA